MVLYAGTRGYLDKVEVADVGRYETGLLDWFHGRHADQLQHIVDTGQVQDEEALEAAIGQFTDSFVSKGEVKEAPEATPQGDAATRVVDSPRTLPEEDGRRARRAPSAGTSPRTPGACAA